MRLLGIIQLVNRAFYAYNLLLVVYALMSFFPNAYETTLGKWVVRLVQPYIQLFDRYIPPVGGLSFNVVIAAFVLEFARKGLISVLLFFV
ncbi:MAG: YggT family protein [Aerococcaceae bacterium]|nr:YggT family protein [Aerococcaceae bacterium]